MLVKLWYDMAHSWPQGLGILLKLCGVLQESCNDEVKLLRSGLTTAETQRDQLMLRLQALQAAAAASSDPAMKEALAQDAEAATAAERRARSPCTADKAAGAAEGANARGTAAGGEGEAPSTGLLADVGVVQTLRARVSELETELRQVGYPTGRPVLARGSLGSACWVGCRCPEVLLKQDARLRAYTKALGQDSKC